MGDAEVSEHDPLRAPVSDLPVCDERRLLAPDGVRVTAEGGVGVAEVAEHGALPAPVSRLPMNGQRRLLEGERLCEAPLLLAWVWEELSEPMRAALSQLSQLSQPFSIDLAESMVDLSAHDDAPWMPDIVQDLCNRALVRSDEKDGQIRMTLHPLVRGFGRP